VPCLDLWERAIHQTMFVPLCICIPLCRWWSCCFSLIKTIHLLMLPYLSFNYLCLCCQANSRISRCVALTVTTLAAGFGHGMGGSVVAADSPCKSHSDCIGPKKCKGSRGEDMNCREKKVDCKTSGKNYEGRWGCGKGEGCSPDGITKWGQCTAKPTGAPTKAPTTSRPTGAPTPTTPRAIIGSCDVTAESGWTYVFQLADDRTKLDMPADKASAYSNDNAAFIGNVALDTLDLRTSTVEMCAGYTDIDTVQGQCTVACTPLVDADCKRGTVNECIKCLVGQTCDGQNIFWEAADASRNLARNNLSIHWSATDGQTIRGANGWYPGVPSYGWYPGGGTGCWNVWGHGLSFNGNGGNTEFGAHGCLNTDSCTNEGPPNRTAYKKGQKDANVLQIRYSS